MKGGDGMGNASEAKMAYIQRYQAENTMQYKFRASKKYDQDIIEKMASVENKQAYLKALIRADIARNGK